MTSPSVGFYDLDGAEEAFTGHRLFGEDGSHPEEEPFRRTLGPRSGRLSAIAEPLRLGEFSSQSALYYQRLLTTIYHTDFIYLPTNHAGAGMTAMDAFYGSELRAAGQILRPHLERLLFGALEERVRTSLEQTPPELESHCLSLHERQKATENRVVRACLNSKDPVRAARNLLIQFSIDFLSEGSAIARSVMGTYGPVQSSLFKIFIDEYGGGEYERKHSTLFEKMLISLDLQTRPYAYWNEFLPSSFATPNLFQYLAGDHRRFFEYVGAVFYAETTYYHICSQLAAMLEQVFGKGTETEYFDEHFQVDQKHSRVAYEQLVCPLAQKYGEGAIAGILRGYELFRLVGQLGDDDFVAQLQLIDAGPDQLRPAAAGGRHQNPANIVRLPPGSKSSRIADSDTLYTLVEGNGTIAFGEGSVLTLSVEHGVLVPGGRLHTFTTRDAVCIVNAEQKSSTTLADSRA